MSMAKWMLWFLTAVARLPCTVYEVHEVLEMHEMCQDAALKPYTQPTLKGAITTEYI
jgi:hypothetical protein